MKAVLLHVDPALGQCHPCDAVGSEVINLDCTSLLRVQLSTIPVVDTPFSRSLKSIINMVAGHLRSMVGCVDCGTTDVVTHTVDETILVLPWVSSEFEILHRIIQSRDDTDIVFQVNPLHDVGVAVDDVGVRPIAVAKVVVVFEIQNHLLDQVECDVIHCNVPPKYIVGCLIVIGLPSSVHE